MTCKINANTSDGLKLISDTSGVIDIQDNGTTRLTIGDTVDLQATELVLDADADTSIHASTDDQVDFKIGGTDRFSIAVAASTFSHKVGIGIASPNGIFAVSDATVTTEINPTSGIGFIGNRTNHPIAFFINGAEKSRIDTAGRVLIGQNATFVNGSSAKLQVSYVKNSEFGLFIRPSDNNTGGGQPALFQNQAGTSIGSIGATASNISYNTSSDYRLKENVSYSWDATSRLKQLKPARFNWIIDDTNTAIDGFMAHEVTSIVPDAVQGTKDGTKTRTKFIEDAAGNFLFADVEEADWTAGKENGTYPEDSTWTASEDIPDYQSIDHSKLVPLLVKTVQELEARIKTLEDA